MMYIGSSATSSGSRRNKRNKNKRRSAPALPQFSSWRFGTLVILIVAAWFSLWGRAAWVQLYKGEEYGERARRQHTASKIIDLPRGMITDRNGIPLARSVKCYSVSARRSLIKDVKNTAKVLEPILNIPSKNIEAALTRSKNFTWLARHIDDAAATAVSSAKLPGITLESEYKRVYPYRHVAGQLLGFVGTDNKGLEGVERAYEQYLAGSSTRQFILRDALGRPSQTLSPTPKENSEDIALTIDLHIQAIAEEVLASTVTTERAAWGGMLVIDVPTGDVLAWAQYPSFNPNSFKGVSPKVYRNRLALDALEPGSTFKPILLAAAMKEGLINRDTVFDCENGRWTTRTVTIRDDERSYGKLPVRRILAVSSNIGCAKIGLLLGASRFKAFLDSMGFGQRTHLPIPESKGIVRDARVWSEVDTMSASFGQSISVTPLQMAQAYLNIANFGVYRPINLTLNTPDRIQKPGHRIFSSAVAGNVLASMREVVDDGTGRRAAITGISVAGKTGTAQKADRSGSYGNERMASFVGMVPAEKPRYLVVVMIDEPQANKYGGAIAAPAFRVAMERVLAYYGELPSEQKIVKTDTGSKQKTLPNTQRHLPTQSMRDLIIDDEELSRPGTANFRTSADPPVPIGTNYMFDACCLSGKAVPHHRFRISKG